MFFYSELYLGGDSGGFQIIEGDMAVNVDDELDFELEADLVALIEQQDIQFAIDAEELAVDVGEEVEELTADIVEELQVKIEGGFSVND